MTLLRERRAIGRNLREIVFTVQSPPIVGVNDQVFRVSITKRNLRSLV